MKKSKAAEILNSWIIDNDVPLSILSPEEQCIELLDFLVNKLGMLPPKVRVEEVRKAISPEGEEGTFVSWTYKSIWEDENGQEDKLMPTPLTDEEQAEVIVNDAELQDEKK